VEDVEGMEDVEIKPWRTWRAGERRDLGAPLGK
jgi:hypothetical protein